MNPPIETQTSCRQWFRLGLLLCVTAWAADTWAAPATGETQLTEVTARGIAVAGEPSARELALADALREAVRIGAGVDLISQTQVSNFQVDFDRIFTSSFGYVRSYEVLKTGVTFDGMLEVQIRAKVAKGSPELNDRLAIQQLVFQRKKSPRLAIFIEENITALPGAPEKLAQGWFEGAAREMGLNLEVLANLGARGEGQALEQVLSAIAPNSPQGDRTDYLIHVKVQGDYLGRRSLFGALPQHRFSLRCDLRVLYPDSRKILVSIPMPGAEDLATNDESVKTAAREVVKQLLEGRSQNKYPGAYSLFRKLLASWITELDLGALITVEIKGATKPRYDRLIAELGKIQGVTAVFPGTFDRRASSFIEVASRLAADILTQHVQKALGEEYVLDRNTLRYVQFSYEPETPEIKPPGSLKVAPQTRAKP